MIVEDGEFISHQNYLQYLRSDNYEKSTYFKPIEQIRKRHNSISNIKTFHNCLLNKYVYTPFDFEEICNINNHNTTIVEGKIVIPNDYYLVLGDNRPDSQDSRTIGLVHKDDLIGKVKFRMKSLFKFEKIE